MESNEIHSYCYSNNKMPSNWCETENCKRKQHYVAFSKHFHVTLVTLNRRMIRGPIDFSCKNEWYGSFRSSCQGTVNDIRQFPTASIISKPMQLLPDRMYKSDSHLSILGRKNGRVMHFNNFSISCSFDSNVQLSFWKIPPISLAYNLVILLSIISWWNWK